MNYKIIIIGFIMMTAPTAHAVKPKACDGVSQQCTKDIRTDKTIDGQAYSCYECKQTVCKAGGSGPIAGTETTTVWESKAPAYRSLIQAQQPLQFDEADAIFGKRTEVIDAHPKPQSNKLQRHNSVDHRKPKLDQIIAPNNKNKADHSKKEGITKKPKRGTKRPKTAPVEAPSQVTLYDVTSSQLSISWMDNANNEYGVSVERGMPQDDRGGINYNWQHVFNVEERIDSNTKGTGWRTDGDDGLSLGTKYCYRLRAYHQTQHSTYSKPVCTTTLQ